MEINIKKSACIRVGTRHNTMLPCIMIGEHSLLWNVEINYLGIKIVAAKRFTTNLQCLRQKYFRALNGLLGKVGVKSSPLVLGSLVESYCVPVLLYSAESLAWTKSMLNSFENAYSQAFMKIFKTFDKNVVRQCQFFLNYLPLELKLVKKKINFLFQMKNSNNLICKILSNNSGEYYEIYNKYFAFSPRQGKPILNLRRLLWTYFEAQINQGGSD